MIARALASAVRGIGISALVLAPAFSSAEPAQATGAAEAINETEILFLGTAGGPVLRLDRSEPATLLNVDGRY
jgi:hypothetical protein